MATPARTLRSLDQAPSSASPEVGPEPLDAALVELLDHVARELAREYVRVMETAAATEPDGPSRRRGPR